MDQEEYIRKCSNVKSQRVQVDESFVPSLQDEVVEAEDLLTEPRNNHVSVDGILHFNEENIGKCYNAENLSCGFEFGSKSNSGSLDSLATMNGKDDLELEDLDGLLDDVEIEDLERTGGFSSACEEYFLDFEFTYKAEELGSGPYEGSLLQNSSSESRSSGLSGSSTVGAVSESTKVPIALSEIKDDSIDETITYESHGAFRYNPSQPSKVDCLYNISLDIPHLDELDNDYPLACDILSCEKKKGSVEKCQPAALREKRCRKPTQRYIEEFSNSRSKEKESTTGTKNKLLNVSSCDELNIKIKASRKIPGEKYSNGNSDVRFPVSQVCKGRPKKEKIEFDTELLPSDSEEDECLTPKKSRRKDRRKHQRMWTLAEVTKLVDGISEYGVGRWTDIKRFLFSSSSYRTPIDLRDKWRNLLKSSSAQKFNKKEAEKNDEHALRPLPSNVVCRVRELAKIHPYPRQRGSKKSRVCQDDSSVIAKGSPISVSKRNVRRKKCT